MQFGMGLVGLAVLAIAPLEVRAQEKVQRGPIVGQATVIDGDTIEIHGTRIRLHGIDAPESAQWCRVAGQNTRCGRGAAFALADKIQKHVVACEPRDRDRYGRVVAVCRSNGVDLNAWMVASGWALAYRRYSADYVGQEIAASTAKRGIWKGEFIHPWDWRRGIRLNSAAKGSRHPRATPRQPEKCRIKGNISRRGERIYHVPGGRYYTRTRISPSKGERWFCTEAEARAAGWRRSRR